MYMNLSYLQQLQNKASYSLVAAREQFLFVSHERGIAPIMDQIAKHTTYFQDCMIVDQVIGKAAAMMLVRSRVSYVYGKVMSEGAVQVLNKHQIPYSYDTLVPYIINRSNDGMCPMEQTVKDLDDVEEAYDALAGKLAQLRGNKKHN